MGGGLIVDCCVRHSWASEVEVYEYLSAGWREYMMANMPNAWHDHLLGLGPAPTGPLMSPMHMDVSYHNPAGDHVDAASGAGEAKVIDAKALATEYLDPFGVERALLCTDSGLFIPSLPTPAVMLELVRAINDWTAERWVASDTRLYGTILIQSQVPELAAEEIRRVGKKPRMGAVLMAVNGLGRPFGHPVYHPIYQAAADLGLPIIVQAGGDGPVDLLTYPTAGGLPCTYVEHRVLAPQGLMTHVTSLVGQGVLDRFPSLRFLILGGSIAWVMPFLWRFDAYFKAARLEAPWLKELPSEYFRRSFRVGSYPLDYAISAKRMARYLDALPAWDDMVCYASGYPDSDCDSPASLSSVLPARSLSRVMASNALDLFGWSGVLGAESRPRSGNIESVEVR
jgi:predicted TIM-barrel fold metal-dependent hydrolase